MSNADGSLDSWSGIVNNYLKAENLTEKEGSFVVEDVVLVERTNEAGVSRPSIDIYTTIEGKEYIFTPNYTNSKFLKDNISSPKDLIGKKLHYTKIKVQNPSTKQTQDSISLVKVE